MFAEEKAAYHSLLDNATALMFDVLTVFLCWDVEIKGIDPYWVGLSWRSPGCTREKVLKPRKEHKNILLGREPRGKQDGWSIVKKKNCMK